MSCFHEPCALTVVFTALVCSGCFGSGSSLKVVPVNGKVKYKGQPLAGASVGFHPVDPMKGRAAGGLTDAEGNYTLTTFESGAKMAQGALPGDYKVSVSKLKRSSDVDLAERINAMKPEERQNLPQTDKERMATLGGGNVDPRKQQGSTLSESEIPARYNSPNESELKATVKLGSTDSINFDLTD